MKRQRPKRTAARAWDALEERQLLSSAGRAVLATSHGHSSGSPAAVARSSRELNQNLNRVKQAFENSVIELHRMQAGSHVTEAEVLEVQRDLALWPHPPGTSTATFLQQPDSNSAAYVLGFTIDSMYMDGAFSATGWASTEQYMAEDLSALGWPVPQSLLDQTVADMEVVAHAGGVSRAEETRYLKDGIAESNNLGPTDGVPRVFDPAIYLSEHLAGFIHRKG